MAQLDEEPETEDDGVVVPPPAERKWLLTQLAALIARFGPERVVVGPMPWPTEQWFPDKWAGGEPSMRRRIVVLEPVRSSGKLREPPSHVLPRFRNFAVEYRKASRQIHLR